MAYADYTRVLEEIEFPPRQASLKLALMLFLNRANDESGLTWVGRQKLGIATGVGPDQVKNLVRELIADGWITPAGAAKYNAKTKRWAMITGPDVTISRGRTPVYRLNAAKLLAEIARQRAERAAAGELQEQALFTDRSLSAEDDDTSKGGLQSPLPDAMGGVETPHSPLTNDERGYRDGLKGVMESAKGGSPVPPKLNNYKKSGAGALARVHEGPLMGGVETPHETEGSHLWPAFCDLVLAKPDAGPWASGWREARNGDGALVLVAPTRLHYERLEQAVGRSNLKALGYRAVQIKRAPTPSPEART